MAPELAAIVTVGAAGGGGVALLPPHALRRYRAKVRTTDNAHVFMTYLTLVRP
jgi:hypothetical protein